MTHPRPCPVKQRQDSCDEAPPQMSARLILFTRFPRPGEAKTRLIPALGPRGAAHLHRDLAEHTLRTLDEAASAVPCVLDLRYTGASEAEMRGWLGTDRRYLDQGSGDLGSRLALAMGAAFEAAAQRVVIVGTDCPELNRTHLEQAFGRLLQVDLVLGPAWDGGYYLVGLRRAAWARARGPLFSNMPWSTRLLLAESVSRARAAGLEVAQLEPLGDVDRPEDLALWERLRDGGR